MNGLLYMGVLFIYLYIIMKRNNNDCVIYEKLVVLGDEKVGKSMLLDNLQNKVNCNRYSGKRISQIENCI